MTQVEKTFSTAKVFESPANLSAAIVVPTGKVSVCGDVATVEVWKDKKIVDIKVKLCGTYPAVVCDGKLAKEYALKICAVAESEESGVYYIKSLAYAQDENGAYIGINKDKPELLDEKELTAENMFFVKSEVKPVSPFRKITRYYQEATANQRPVETKSYFLGDFSLGKYDFDITNWAGTRRHFDAGKTAFAQNFSKVLVKYNFKSKEPEWVLFDSVSLPQLIDIDFSELSYVVSNNLTNGLDDESCMAGEDLVFLFGEVAAYDEIDVKMTLGETAKADADAALFETARVRAKILSANMDEYVTLQYTRDDGVLAGKSMKLSAAGVDAEGYSVFEFRMRETQAWQNTVSFIRMAFPEGDYELDYVKLFATGNSSAVKLGKALPMLSDGHFE